jgi:hypothetical protein
MSNGAGWSIAKDAAGFIGSILLFIPWARDFRGRSKLEKVKGVATRLSLKGRLQQRRETWLARPKAFDLWISLAGLLLIALSFGISLLIDVRLLPQ